MKKEILTQNRFLDIVMTMLIQLASESTCHRSKCASIIISKEHFDKEQNIIIGYGYNSMPCNKQSSTCAKDFLPENFKSDKTCCVHAEQRAIMCALDQKDKLKDSYLFFIRIDENNNPIPAGDPYCTICSKMALDVGISKFCLWHKEGWVAYDTEYYNNLSFQFNP